MPGQTAPTGLDPHFTNGDSPANDNVLLRAAAAASCRSSSACRFGTLASVKRPESARIGKGIADRMKNTIYKLRGHFSSQRFPN